MKIIDLYGHSFWKKGLVPAFSLGMETPQSFFSFNPIPNRLGHMTYNERADSALTW